MADPVIMDEIRFTMDTIRTKLKKTEFPDYMRRAIETYIEFGIIPGLFLTGIIENKFRETIFHADGINLKLLPEYAFFFSLHVPTECHGSPSKLMAWNRQGGLTGGHFNRDT